MKKDTEKEKWWAMNREERLRRQKEFLISFAFGAVWLVILWVVLKAAGSVLFPFLAAFAVAALLAGAVKFITENTYQKRNRGGYNGSFLLYTSGSRPLFCRKLSGEADL